MKWLLNDWDDFDTILCAAVLILWFLALMAWNMPMDSTQ